MDSEDENNQESDGINLAGFLFGNIDEKGQLENDFLDQETKKFLPSLTKFGLNSILSEVISDTEIDTKRCKTRTSDEDSSDSDDDDNKYRRQESTGSPTVDYSKKNDGAVDFSDINELADEQLSPQSSSKEQENGKSDSQTESLDIEEAIPASKVTTETTAKPDGEEHLTNDEKALMPPPLTIPSVQKAEEVAPKLAEKKIEKKLETPLGSMLPSKYQNVDVTEIFPDFRQDKVLRFSRLFGPGKFSSLPQIWRSVRRRAKKKRKEREMKMKDSDSTSDSDEPRRCNGFNLRFAPTPPRDACMSDDEEKLLREVSNEEKEEKQDKDSGNESKNKVADWRFGPAQVWYDMLDVPETGEGFNYGFKLKSQNDEESNDKEEEPELKCDPIPDDAFLMVSQLHWEDEVVWDGNDIKHKVLQKLNSKTNAAGWLPSSGSRTASFSQQKPVATPSTSVTNPKSQTQTQGKISKLDKLIKQEEPDDTWYSIFPVENEELIYTQWEADVIWDSENMTKIPKPKVLTLDPNDENIILGIPDDIDPATIQRNVGPTPKVKIPHPHVKKSKILLGKAGVINVLAEDTPPPPPKSPDRDPFNISNDVYYMAKTSEATLRIKVGGGNLLQHSTPVVELRSPFIPTHMGPMKLRMFHRPAMKKYSHGALASTSPQLVNGLLKHIKKKAKQREQERIASGGGEIFFMRTPEDLTGKDGELILIEFCEEHPPLMNQVGMCSKLKNYYKRKPEKDTGPPEMKYGEVAYAHTSPFLGIIYPGQSVQVVENNMYRAPIYEHKIYPTDFLIIRTRSNYFIRELDALFTGGQQCPLYEVPGPNSKRANNFVRDFLQVFIYRLFWKSKDNPRKIRMDDIKKAFPAHSESSIRKRLKLCADFKRTGMDSNFWVIKPDFRLPSEEELRSMVSPEQCCAYFSMIAAEQRLKDAGYGEKFIFAQPEDDDEEMQMKMDDEVKVAPWNTTRAYIQAMRGKCILQLNGPADPTGCGEGFSYIRMPNKPTQNKEEQESQPKRTVTGTDADLRRLSLNNAKALLRKFGVPEEEIKKLSRWEVIDVVRTLSTEKAKAGEEGMDKFSRGNRFSIAEHQERYKEECQRIFDLQNKVLASEEVLSTDEGESTASEESEIEEWGKNLENMLANKKTSTQLSLEREEQERQELLKIMEGKSKKSKDKDSQPQQPTEQLTKILKITRTFKNSEGKEFTRVEIVRRAPVVDAYVKIRTTKDEAFIRNFATIDEAQKEEMKREKRRIQEQLRRIKRNQEKIGLLSQQNPLNQPPGIPISLGDRNTNLSQVSKSSSDKDTGSRETTPSKKKIKLKPDLKLKCGACGRVGHMRTNKACPQYSGILPTPSLQVAMTEEQEEEIERELNDDDEDLVKTEGTKVKLSSKLLKRHEDVKRRTLLLKVPKDAVKGKRRRMGLDAHCDYLRYHKSTNRARTDPIVVLSSILEEILNEMRDMPDVQPFMFPVNPKKVPDYQKIVQQPMDLQTIRESLRQRKYHSREEFLNDVNQIVENSSLYNGANNALTMASQRMLQKCVDRLAEKEEKLMRLEKAINPLLDDDDQVALSFIFEKLLNTKLKIIPESWPFLKPVNKKQVKDYYSIIQRPMDLETITKKVLAHKYHSRAEFLADIQLIADNCEKFNGSESEFTKKAKDLVDITRMSLEEFEIAHLEQNIALVQEKARAEADWGDDESYDIETPMDRSAAGSPVPSTSGLSRPAPPLIPPQPEVKRSRGRPRKHQPTDDGKTQKEKINKVEDIIDVVGVGGPAVPLPSAPVPISIQTGGYEYLKQDLQYSTDENLSRTSFGSGIDDSQQAAEAMVQLSGVGFYSQPQQQEQDESIDFDPNYDPSDFLMKKVSGEDQKQPQPQFYQQDSYEYMQKDEVVDEQQQNYYSSSYSQAYQVQETAQEVEMQDSQPLMQQEQKQDIGISEDLEISDSDEEESKIQISNSLNQSSEMNTSKEEEDDLWF